MHIGKYLFLAGELCRIEHISTGHDEMIVYNFDLKEKRVVSHRGATLISVPAFRIGDLSHMLGRKPNTIRKWERMEWIPKAKKYDIGVRGQKFIRFYTPNDVEVIRDMVESVHRGRPRKDKRVTSTLPSEGNLKSLLRERIQKIK